MLGDVLYGQLIASIFVLFAIFYLFVKEYVIMKTEHNGAGLPLRPRDEPVQEIVRAQDHFVPVVNVQPQPQQPNLAPLPDSNILPTLDTNNNNNNNNNNNTNTYPTLSLKDSQPLRPPSPPTYMYDPGSFSEKLNHKSNEDPVSSSSSSSFNKDDVSEDIPTNAFARSLNHQNNDHQEAESGSVESGKGIEKYQDVKGKGKLLPENEVINGASTSSHQFKKTENEIVDDVEIRPPPYVHDSELSSSLNESFIKGKNGSLTHDGNSINHQQEEEGKGEEMNAEVDQREFIHVINGRESDFDILDQLNTLINKNFPEEPAPPSLGLAPPPQPDVNQHLLNLAPNNINNNNNNNINNNAPVNNPAANPLVMDEVDGDDDDDDDAPLNPNDWTAFLETVGIKGPFKHLAYNTLLAIFTMFVCIGTLVYFPQVIGKLIVNIAKFGWPIFVLNRWWIVEHLNNWRIQLYDWTTKGGFSLVEKRLKDITDPILDPIVDGIVALWRYISSEESPFSEMVSYMLLKWNEIMTYLSTQQEMNQSSDLFQSNQTINEIPIFEKESVQSSITKNVTSPPDMEQNLFSQRWLLPEQLLFVTVGYITLILIGLIYAVRFESCFKFCIIFFPPIFFQSHTLLFISNFDDLFKYFINCCCYCGVFATFFFFF